MRTTFSLGRISGIRIGVNWSVLLIVALLAYGLAAGQFPAEVPRRPKRNMTVPNANKISPHHRLMLMPNDRS